MGAYSKIIASVTAAQEIASAQGIPNICQPGLIKEMIIAEKLGHQVISDKKKADAHWPGQPDRQFEYLCKAESTSGYQMARVNTDCLYRVTRNEAIIFAEWKAENHLHLLRIYSVPAATALKEVVAQVNRKKDGHGAGAQISFSSAWVQENGKLEWAEH